MFIIPPSALLNIFGENRESESIYYVNYSYK